MSQRIIRQLIDDLDDAEIPDGKGGSVEFGLRGTAYTIDLSDKNIAKLGKAFAPFVNAASVSAPETSRTRAPRAGATTKSARAKRPGHRKAGRAGVKSTATIRSWAAENGLDVSARGRIPAAVTEAYDAARAPAN